MKSYCLKWRKFTENINPRVSGTSNGKAMILWKCQEAKGLLSNLGVITPLSKVPILGNTLFWEYKMNEIVNKFL